MNAMTEIAPEDGADALAALSGPERRINRVRLAFERLPIARKLSSIFMVQIAMLFAIGVSAWWGLGSIEQSIEEVDGGLSQELSATIGTMRWVIFGAIAIAVAYSITAMRHMAVDFSSNLSRVTQDMLALAKGEQDIDIPCLDRGDEIGDLSRALQVFRRAYGKMQRLREERERARDEHAKLLHGLATQFEQTVSEVVAAVASASTQLQATSSTMASSANQSATQASDVVKAMEDASAGVTAAASASDEFAMSINEISRQASSSAELARKASGAANEADHTISALADSADQVGQIVELIQSIAQRTNLLALNASIEAARGGEAGRGFAVVAAEVKELASQTSRATQDVAEQVRSMQESTGASVAALKAITGQIEQLETTAISIAAAVDQQSVAGQDLARSIDIAARSTDEVSVNVGQMREAALSTGAAASQVLSSATELESQATVLRTQVEGFLSHVRRS